jgi:thioredoxin-like negative regulator of GroEL
MQAVTLESFEQFVAEGTVVLDCSAVWCGPCKVFAPVFHAAAARRPRLKFGTIDTEAEPALAAQLDIRAQPTVVVLSAGKVIYKQVGAMSAAKFDALLDRFDS